MAVLSRQAEKTKTRRFIERKLIPLRQGDPLPPTRALMEEFGVSKKRLEGVLGDLESEGFIERRARQGIFKANSEHNDCLPGSIEFIAFSNTTTTLEEQYAYLENGYYKGGLIDAAIIEASKRCQALRFHFCSDEASLASYKELACRSDVRAVIFIWLHEAKITDIFDEHGVAWVSVHPGRGPHGHCCIVPAPNMAQLQLEHLWQLGHERIAYMWADSERKNNFHYAINQRRESYYRLMAEHHLKVEPHWVVPATFHEESIAAGIDQIFSQKPYPTALIVADPHLLTAYRCLEQRGLEVGRDISVVGGDDLGIARIVSPQATTVRNPADVALKLAFDNLNAILHGEKVDDAQYVPLELVVRESTSPMGESVLHIN